MYIGDYVHVQSYLQYCELCHWIHEIYSPSIKSSSISLTKGSRKRSKALADFFGTLLHGTKKRA